MPIFKVRVQKCLGVNSQRYPFFNPFLVRDVFAENLPKVRYNVREWEFEAANEAEVRSLFEEAKRLGVNNVAGYELCLIEEVLT